MFEWGSWETETTALFGTDVACAYILPHCYHRLIDKMWCVRHVQKPAVQEPFSTFVMQWQVHTYSLLLALPGNVLHVLLFDLSKKNKKKNVWVAVIIFSLLPNPHRFPMLVYSGKSKT